MIRCFILNKQINKLNNTTGFSSLFFIFNITYNYWIDVDNNRSIVMLIIIMKQVKDLIFKSLKFLSLSLISWMFFNIGYMNHMISILIDK